MPLRDALANVDPYRPQPPARVLAERLGLERLTKLGSNEGALGPLPEAVAAYEATAAELARYPDGDASDLRAALAERHGVAPEQVVPGNGADELIRLCGAAALDAGDAAVFPWPSFPSYVSAAAVHGATPLQVPLNDRRAVDVDALLDACDTPAPGGGRVRVVFLANPNNPTGTLLDPSELRRFLDSLPDRILCVLDEAYAEYADPEPGGPALLREGRPRLCVLRTFSKVYGLAGLRVGYALASPEAARALDRVRPIFNVNQPAQAAAVASLAARDAIGERVAHTRAAREQLRETLAASGLRPVASQANFVYADVPGGDGAGLAERLLAEGFIVRALDGFGAPGAIRVTCGTDEENAAFAEALARVVRSG
ncbi:MAG TPA: histidinol-phosphate transaminase [Thermoleophilaceae bacterium]|nr:histidinol-phosphate transaminase [Thermoleophilaceae bacterium]